MKKNYTWLSHLFNFLAVILGVYLAFYMNESAKENEDKKESIMLMNSLISDLSEDIENYENYQIPINKQILQNVEDLLEILSTGSFEDVEDPLSAILQVENFAPTSSTYSSMKSSGKLRLIEDLTLQKKLADFYEGLAAESLKKGEYQVEYFTNELLTWLVNNVDFMDNELLHNGEIVVLRNKLFIYGSLIDQKIKSYEMVVNKSKDLKESIESLLKSK